MHAILGIEFHIEKLQPNNVFINFNPTYSPITVNCDAHVAIHDMATHSPKSTNTSSSLVQIFFSIWTTTIVHYIDPSFAHVSFLHYSDILKLNSPPLDPIMYHFHNSHFSNYSQAFYRQSGLSITALFLTILPSFPLPLLNKSTNP